MKSIPYYLHRHHSWGKKLLRAKSYDCHFKFGAELWIDSNSKYAGHLDECCKQAAGDPHIFQKKFGSNLSAVALFSFGHAFSIGAWRGAVGTNPDMA